MNRKHLILPLALALGATATILPLLPAEAAPCADGMSKKVVKTGGTASGFPSSCKINVCRTEGVTGIVQHIENFPSIGIVLDAAYEVVDGYVSNNCPSSVNNALWGNN